MTRSLELPSNASGSSLNKMMAVMPERTYDVGIAEQHAVTFSAGLATQGIIPFCNIYSTFLQRAYDQVIHDVAIQNLNVIFCLIEEGLLVLTEQHITVYLIFHI